MKKHWLLLALLGLLPVLLSVFACVPVEQPEPDWPIVMVTADITTPTTWTAGNVYVIEVFDFSVTNTLTIPPGTIVKFHPVQGPSLTLGPEGIIYAEGALDSPIVFTSFYDDAHGGDSDGGATPPAAMDWDQIDTNGEGTTAFNSCVFDFCEFYYGGGGTYPHTLAITADSNNVTVTNCTFAHNGGGDPMFDRWGALDANGGEASTIIQNNVFYDNVQPLSISDRFDLDDSNDFHNPLNLTETNTANGIFVYTEGIFSGDDIAWAETEVAYVIDDADWWIYTGGSLTLADNVVLKFDMDSKMTLQAGPSTLINYDGTGVAFTDYYDDTLKGDTNGDESSTGQSNWWYGIWDGTILPAGGYVDWPNVLYD